MSEARSQVLLVAINTNAAGAASFQCPAGHVTLVKSAYFHNRGTAAQEINLAVISGTLSQQMYVLVQTVDPGATVPWEGWFALNPGDYVQVIWQAAGADAWVSGAVLNGENQFPPGVGATTKPGPPPLATPKR